MPSDLFIYVDFDSFVVDAFDRIWIVQQFFDDTGLECEPDMAVSADVICEGSDIRATAILSVMNHPEVH